MGEFRIHVEKDYIGFSSGHFVTYDGDACEPLHGHNYRVGVRLEGALDENNYVLDFVVLKRLMKRLCDELDHRMLLAQHNPQLTLEQTDDAVTVVYKRRRYVFPREDVVLLPVPNTTAEMLAQYLCRRLLEALQALKASNLRSVAIEVEESPGQSAIYCETLPVPDMGS